METVLWSLALYGLLRIVFWMGQQSILMVLKDDIRERIERGELTSKNLVSQVVDLDDTSDECLINVERHNETYYAFASTGEFLAQGRDFMAMFDQVKQRFPERNFRVNRTQAELSAEESQRMVKAIFDTFGDKKDERTS